MFTESQMRSKTSSAKGVLRLGTTVAIVTAVMIARPAFAIIDLGSIAALGAIAKSTAATVSALRATTDLLEIGEGMREALSDRQEDADSLQDLFEEISPDGRIGQGEDENVRELRAYQARLSQTQDTIGDVDAIKWDSKYLSHRIAAADPKRVASWARTASRAVRLGKKIARLIPKSHEEQTAMNTETITAQNYAMAHALIDIRNEIRGRNERDAALSIQGSLNTAKALADMDQEIGNDFRSRTGAGTDMDSGSIRRGLL